MSPGNGQSFTFEGFRLDPAEKSLYRDTAPLPLTPKVFDTLQVLIANAGHLVEKRTMMDAVWGGRFVEESNLTHNIKVLRKALGDDASSPRFIETVAGRGYRFIAPVRREDSTFEVADRQARREKSDPPRPYVLVTLGMVLLLFISGLAFVWYRGESRNFAKGRRDPVTANGIVSIAAVAPNGGVLVYAQKDKTGESLWKQQLPGGETTQLMPPAPVQFVGLSVAPSGDFAYYTTFAENAVALKLSRIPLTGGEPEQLPIESDVSVSFSPDGKKFAYTESQSALQQTTLKIADSDGRNSTTLIAATGEKRVLPVFRTNPVSWSPDGGEIACVVQETEGDESNSRILLVDPESGSERYLSEQRWPYVTSIAWINNETLGLASVDPTESGTQLWSVSRRTGQSKSLASGLDNYAWLSAANGVLYAVHDISYSSIFVADFDENLIAPQTKQIFNEPGVVDSIDWRGDRVYYNSTKSGKNEIWQLEVTGTSPRQLTENSNLTFGFTVSPTDGSLVFSAAQKQRNYLFVADSNGQNVRQLTSGINDSSPRFTPDGKEVIYQQGSMIKPTLWKVAIDGTGAQQVTGYYALQPSVSPDGKTISYQFMDFKDGNRVWRMGLMDRETGRLQNKLDFPDLITERRTAWRPGDDLLTVTYSEGLSEGFLLMSADGLSRKIPNITNDRITAFAWSPDGSRLAFAAVKTTSDVTEVSR
ncbi:MAG TPA: winged helix-turn-helix domain-containing protein [Pyrinomonadaceae bacterium]|nr:winged helix-turn-helix domain-containing protein [Pyrinomonadaceae bacterium]